MPQTVMPSPAATIDRDDQSDLATVRDTTARRTARPLREEQPDMSERGDTGHRFQRRPFLLGLSAALIVSLGLWGGLIWLGSALFG